MAAESVSSVVSGSGQSIRTRLASEGRSRRTSSTLSGGMPSIWGEMSGRQMSVGRTVVGRWRPAWTTSAPSRALTRALLPVPVPPRVATTRGASIRRRSESARWASRRTRAWQGPPGCQGGRRVGPALEPGEQRVDLGQQFEMVHLRACHIPRIADGTGSGSPGATCRRSPGPSAVGRLGGGLSPLPRGLVPSARNAAMLRGRTGGRRRPTQ